ncbi:MAG: hypothetical protein ACK5LT_13210 [Lachnospirales bacterium]
MINSINYSYYLNLQKPSIRSGSIGQGVRSSKGDKNSFTNLSLSKAYKNNAVDYVQDFTSTINSIKASVLDMMSAYSNLDKDVNLKGYSQTKEVLNKKTKKFVNDIKKLKELSFDTTVDGKVKDYYNVVDSFLKENIETLGVLGLNYKNGELEFEEEYFQKDTINKVMETKDESYNFFSQINNESNDFMGKSIDDLLKFNDFSYYFNYSLGAFKKDSFNALGTGILVDIQL